MKIYLQQDCYNWLVSLNILKAYFFTDQIDRNNNNNNNTNRQQTQVQKSEVCYDDQIYLENGYLVGVLLKQILKGQSLWSQKLLKIRKITVLKLDENWEIVKQILTYLQFPVEQLEQQYDAVQIAKILQYLYQVYGPNKNSNKHQRKKYFHVDPFKIKLQEYSYENCQNLIQFTCLLLHRSLNVNISQCLGLLIQKGKYVKHVIVNGANIQSQENNPFERVVLLYKELLSNMDRFSELLNYQENNFQFFMEIFAQGVLSQSQTVAKLACLLMQSVSNPQWFYYGGFDIMSCSNHEFIYNLLLDKFKNELNSIFNVNLHQRFLNTFQFIQFLTKLVRVLPKTIYCKQVLESMPIYYMIDKGLEAFDIENVESSQSKTRLLSRELIQALFTSFNSKFTQNDRIRSLIAFQNNFSMNYCYIQTISLLTNLFEIIKVLLVKQEIIVEKYFKLAMKYLTENLEVHQFVMENMIQIYRKLMKSFPLGCFLSSYKILEISQCQDFAVLLQISQDSTLLEDQIISALRIASTYYMSINGDCYMEIIKNLIKFKQSVNWASFLTTQLIGNWNNIKLPPLTSSQVIKKDSLCRFQAFGIKRRQILKFQQYQKYKTLLDNCCQIKDKPFLKQFQKKVNKKIKQIQRQKTRQQYKLYLMKLQKNIKVEIERLPIPSQLVLKSLSYSRQGMSYQSNFRQTQNQFENKEKNKKMSLPSIPYQLQIPTQRSNQNQNSQNQFEEGQNLKDKLGKYQEADKFDEDLNQFLISESHVVSGNPNKEQFQVSSKANVHNQQSININIEPISPYSSPRKENTHQCLLPFTQIQPLKSKTIKQGYFLTPQIMENYQILYIKIFQQENQGLIDKITQIYSRDGTFQDFLRQTKLIKYLDFNSAQQIHQKCKSLHIDNHSIVNQLMVQLGFLMFGFKRNKRVSITSLESFLKILKENLSYQDSQQSNKKYLKQMEFQYKISKKINIPQNKSKDYKKNKKTLNTDSPFIACFQIIDQLLKSSLNIHLPQPLSKVSTKIIKLSKQKQKQLQDAKQLQSLQKLLQNQNQNDKVQAQPQQNQKEMQKLLSQKIKTQKRRLKLRSPPKLNQSEQQHNRYNVNQKKKMAPMELKQKLQKRKKELTIQLSSKAVKNLLSLDGNININKNANNVNGNDNDNKLEKPSLLQAKNSKTLENYTQVLQI